MCIFIPCLSILANDITLDVDIGDANSSTVTGRLTLVQSGNTSEVTIKGTVSDLPEGPYALHIHEKKLTTNNCTSAGEYFNILSVSPLNYA